ncbi:MAG: VOC family protein [Wenzhouxiangella sp.]|jgi:extradiol dioxygenase family protein|nr:VOC family protein [Wenzhouxiangella sp.]
MHPDSSSNRYPRFHLALPVTDLLQTLAFYTDILGCGTGRSDDRWVDVDFFGHQLVLHLVEPDQHPAASTNPVDGHAVPASHFGPILEWDDFHALADRLRAAGVDFVIEPYLRFEGLRGEQATMFVADPSGNHLEFKSFRNIEMLFAKNIADATL